MGRDKAPLKVVVTGARGFIGSRLLAPLVAGGADVTALVRNGHDRVRLKALGVAVRVAPITPGPDLVNALSGHDVLINLAYDMRAGMDENLAMFDALLEAAQAGDIGRIVHISSAVVYDGWPGKPIDENSPITDPTDRSYRSAKIAMEKRLMAGAIEAAILQPTIVYGPGSALWTAAPMAALGAGGVVLPDPVGTCAAVYVDDVVAAIMAAVRQNHLGQERFLINGPEAVAWDRFYQGYRDILGQGDIMRQPVDQMRANLGPLPSFQEDSGPTAAARISAQLRRLLGSRRFDAIMGKVRRLAGSKGPKLPDHHMFALLLASPVVSTDKARSVLGFAPEFDFDKGLAGIAATTR